MITTEMLKVLVKQAGEKHEEDLVSLETTSFLGGLIAIFGIEALDIARKSEERLCEVLTFPTGRFDLKTHPRPQFLRQLQGCTGLAEQTCEHMLSAIETLVHETLTESPSFKFEHLGTINRSGGVGFSLKLEESLAVHV